MKTNCENLDRKYIWHPFTQMTDWLKSPPLVISHGKGNYLYDTGGKRYLDGISSLWVNVHGHAHPRLDRALKKQLKKIAHSTLLGLSNPPAAELAERLIGIAPRSLEKVFYSDDGSTAVEIALKMAYQYQQQSGRKKKKYFIKLENAYHGDTLGSVSVGGINLFHSVYRSLLFKTYAIPSPYCYRCPLKKIYPSCGMACLDPLETLLKKRGDSIAGVILEPVMQAAAGMILEPRGYLKKVQELTRRYDVLMIVDEVATGFGRTGKMFASEHEKIRPDLMTVAKSITGGYLPLAATLASQKIFDGFLGEYKEQKTFFHGHTYTGNPLACAVAIENLNIFETEGTLEKIKPLIRLLRKMLKEFSSLPFVGDIRQAGLMVGIEMVQDRAKKTPFRWEDAVGIRICAAARKRGIILRPLGNVIVLMPPLSITTREIKLLVDGLKSSIEEVCI